MEFIKKNKEMIMVGAAFLFFFLMSCYKLTAAPLWYDETLEFYFSKDWSGAIENVTGLQSLYERLVYYSFQPPLYNLFMKVWLLFGESEWWFRFSCVIFALISAAGLFKTVKYKADTKTAALSVALYPLLYEIMYYFRECAEYALLLAVITWVMYFYFKALEEEDTKYLLVFTLLCVVAVYSQYGAVFIIMPMAVSLLIEKWMKAREKVKVLLSSYIVAVFGAGFPLYWWFMRIQLSVQDDASKKVSTTIEFLKDNVFYDFFKNLSYVFSWSLIDFYSIERFEILTALLLVGMIILSVFIFVCGKNRGLNHLLIGNVVSWVLYYVLVKSNVYARGGFGNRYNVFFVPVWFVTMVLLAYESIKLVKERFQKKWAARALMLLFAATSLFIVALNIRKMPHIFEKSNTREAVEAWYEQEGYHSFTYVCFGENVSFEYYLTHNDNYKEEYKDNIYMEFGDEITDTREKEYEEYIAIITEQCGGTMPDELYISTGNRFAIVEALEAAGYTSEIVYQTNTTLFHVHK